MENLKNRIIELLNGTADEHPIKLAYKKSSRYFDDFIKGLDALANRISIKDIEDIVKNKLQIGNRTFRGESYYQSATELSVLFYAMKLNPDCFSYEVPLDLNTKKNPECSISFNESGFEYNFEAKCPFHSGLEEHTTEVIVLRNYGRAPSKKASDDHFNYLGKSLKEADGNLEVVQIESDDNKLKDYLLSANSKFSCEKKDNVFNLLFVALDDKMEMNSYYGYLYGAQGLFTPNSFVDKTLYANVDCVVLTNSYFRHKNNDIICGSAWDVNDGFNLVFLTPSYFHSKNDMKVKVTSFFSKYLTDYASSMMDYAYSGMNEDAHLSRDREINCKEILPVLFFINHLEENNCYLFEAKEYSEGVSDEC